MITPFKADGCLDIEGLKKNIHHQIEEGIDGLLFLGTTGEAPTLTLEEKTLILKTAKEAIKGRVPLIAGTGHNATHMAVELTKMAESLGVDAALIVSPYYNKPTQEGLYQHFSQIAKNTRLPIILYNIQGRSGVNITPATVERLSQIPSIVAIKESSGSVTQASEIIEKRPQFTLLSGDDALTLPMLSIGGQGVISVVSNLFPSLVKEMVDSALKCDYKRAKELHFKLSPLFRTLFIETNPIPVKRAMTYFKRPAGPCRLPLCPLTEENEKKLLSVLATYG